MTVQLAFTAALALVSAGFSPVVAAADFAHSKKTYVPPSLIDRRVDFTSVREHQALEETNIAEPGQPTDALTSHVVKTVSVHRAPKNSHPYGALPAPPTVAHGKSAIPPPPPYSAAQIARATKALQSRVRQIASSPETQQTLAEWRKKAEEFARSGQLDEAKHAVAKALQLTPHDKALIREVAGISVQRAKQFATSQDFDKSIRYARQALAFDHNDGEARTVLDKVLEKTGVNAGDAAERMKSADLLAAQGRNEEAAVEYRAALRLKPTPQAHIGLGNIDLRAGEKDKAKLEYQQALEVDPGYAAAHRQLGLLKLSNNDVVGANSQLSRALVLDPHDKASAQALIDLWQQQVSKVPGGNSHLGLARAYQLAGDLQSAQSEYRQVVAIDPSNPNLPAARQSFKLALAREESRKASEAAHTLETQGAVMDAYTKILEAEKLNPGDAEFRVYQGHLLEKMRNSGAARQAYLDALKVDPHNTLAAARLKALPAQSAMIAPPAELPTTPAVLSAASAAAMPGYHLPPGAARSAVAPAVQHDPVNQLSSFALALRNHIVVQKSASRKVEDATQDVMTALGGNSPSEALHTLGGASALGLGATAPSAPAAAPVAAADSLGDSVGSALSNAAAAVAAAGGTPSTLASAPLSSAPSSASFAPPPPSAAIAPADDMPPLAPPINLQSAAPPAVAPVATALSALQGVEPQAALRLTPLTPKLAPVTSAPAAAASDSLNPIAANSVSLQLTSASPKLTGVELNVTLRNDSDQMLVLPAKMRAVIHYRNRNEAEVKPVFADATVPAHSGVQGTIKVPFDKVDPSADLFIPNLLPQGVATRDVHLTVQMASRQPF